MPKRTQIAEPAPIGEAINLSTSSNTAVEIELSLIVPSPFEPQARRRAKFDAGELEELGQSIRQHGLAQPIVVRIKNQPGKPLEIVFGERRWLASRIVGLGKILCFVRDYDDAKVIELQYEENHRRQKNDPLDDAYYFKYLKERTGYSDDDLADRLNTTVSNVRDKLKLNDLIDEAREELSAEHLPLKHAYYLARFPAETQKEIVREHYAYRHYDRDEKPVSFETFRDEVEENILRRLLGAPFDVSDPRLHIRGLLCRDCPDNSAHATHLFPELATAPRCLNKPCFQIKTNTHLRLQRDEIAAQLPNPTHVSQDEVAASIPLVTERKYTSERTPFKEKVLTGQELLDEPECEFSELAVAVEGERKGQKVWVCRNLTCPVHHPKPVQDDISDDELSQIEIEFDNRVAKAVRVKILKSAMQWFDDRKTFWAFDDLIKNLIVNCIFDVAGSCHGDFLTIVRGIENAPKNFSDPDQIRLFVNTLDKGGQSQLLFLLSAINADDLELTKILKDYTNLNFFRLDAEARFELAPTEFKSVAADYVAAVEKGQDAEVPRFWRCNYDDVAIISGEEN
jgi:ParB family chromosome partitioning protein